MEEQDGRCDYSGADGDRCELEAGHPGPHEWPSLNATLAAERQGEPLPDGEDLVGIEVPADGTEAVLEGDPDGVEAPPLEVEGAQDGEPEFKMGPTSRDETDAPTMPWEIRMNMATYHFTRRADGSRMIHFTAGMPTQQGLAMMPPQIVVPFGKEGWEKFQRDVAADGERAPQIATSKVMPSPRRPPSPPMQRGRRR